MHLIVHMSMTACMCRCYGSYHVEFGIVILDSELVTCVSLLVGSNKVFGESGHFGWGSFNIG